MLLRAKTLTPEQQTFLNENSGFYNASIDVIETVVEYLGGIDDPRAKAIISTS